MVKRVSIKTVTGCWAMICLLGNACAGLPETIVKVRPTIVIVATFNKLATPAMKLMGTGFVIGDGTVVVTNSHEILPTLAANGSGHGSSRIVC